MSVPGHKQRQDLTGAVVGRGRCRCTAGWTPSSTPTCCSPTRSSGRRGCGARTGAGSRWPDSTHGNQALALAVGSPGQEVIVTRCLHRSLLLGLVLAGLRPVWVQPSVHRERPARRGRGGHRPGRRWPATREACAVFLGDPSYVGTTGDLAGHAQAAHEAGVPLIVDAAWAAHLGFHPGLPPHAIAAGADAMVTSAHKALPAYTQGALVLARTGLLDPARLDRAFDATHTTSPAGTIAASIDAARALLARDGTALCARLLRLAAAARQRLAGVPGVGVLDGPGWSRPSWWCCWQLATGAHGNAVEADLIAAGMPVEMADRDTIIPILTIADDEAAVDRFTEVLVAAIERHRGAPRQPVPSPAWTVTPQMALPPREAFSRPTKRSGPMPRSGGSAPSWWLPTRPACRCSRRARSSPPRRWRRLRAAHAEGGWIAYAADPSLDTLAGHRRRTVTPTRDHDLDSSRVCTEVMITTRPPPPEIHRKRDHGIAAARGRNSMITRGSAPHHASFSPELRKFRWFHAQASGPSARPRRRGGRCSAASPLGAGGLPRHRPRRG